MTVTSNPVGEEERVWKEMKKKGARMDGDIKKSGGSKMAEDVVCFHTI